MSEAVMDRQVTHLLNMKFAGLPNQYAIEEQLEELGRINQAYTLAREDPNNLLLRGLANFRVELFNRVGELAVAGQSQMGKSTSSFRVVEEDALNRGLIKGARVTRGLEGRVEEVLRERGRAGSGEECGICLLGVRGE
jgi:hypothetical protein